MPNLNPAQDLLDIYSMSEQEASEANIFTVIKNSIVAGSPAIMLTNNPITGKITVNAPFTNVLQHVYTDGVTLTGDGTPANPIRRL